MEYLNIGEAGIPVWDEVGNIHLASNKGVKTWWWLAIIALVIIGLCILYTYNTNADKATD